MEKRHLSRHKFHKQLLNKYACGTEKKASEQQPKAHASTRVIDEDALPAVAAAPASSSNLVEPTETADVYDDNDDEVFIKEAMNKELQQGGTVIEPKTQPEIPASSQPQAAPWEEKDKRRRQADLDSNDETQRRKHEKRRRDAILDSEEEVERRSKTIGAYRRRTSWSSGDEVQRKQPRIKQEEETRQKQKHDRDTAPAATGITYRDRQGRRITEAEWKDLGASRRFKPEQKKQRVEKISEKDLAWGGGLVQKRMEEERKQYEAEVAKEPFSRYEVTASFDQELKEKEIWEDPMRKTGQSRKPQDSKPKCKFPAPPNRYHILPGSKWDGKVRGTNFEERFLQAVNAAKKEEPVFIKRAF